MDTKAAPDQEVARIAALQHGVVSVSQLHAAGLSATQVLRRCRSGRLHRLHRGVYAVGHIAPSNQRRWLAAVLALSEGTDTGHAAVLSHRSAAELWGLLTPSAGAVDVSLRSRSGRLARDGVRIHRPAALAPAEITVVRAIPVTAPARTLSDLRRSAAPQELRRAVRQADMLGLSTGEDNIPDRTRSELELLFLRLCRRHRLPAPAVNVRIGALTVDFCWARPKVVVETDGYRYHRGRAAFEDDRARDLQLRALGYQVIRLSYRQVMNDSVQVALALKRALGAS